MAEPPADPQETPAPPQSRRGGFSFPSLRVRLLLWGLVFLVGLALQLERHLPIGSGKAARLARAFLVEADPAFRPDGFRAEVIPRDFGRGEMECWEVGFFDRRTGARYREFFVYVYLADGLCVLSHTPRFGPRGERYMEGDRR